MVYYNHGARFLKKVLIFEGTVQIMRHRMRGIFRNSHTFHDTFWPEWEIAL
jgi:hypothetical protein